MGVAADRLASGWRAFSFWAIVLLVFCGLTGRMSPHLVRDSPSYLDYAFSPATEMARQSRTPVYPLVLRACKTLTPASTSLHLVVALQILLHALAVSLLSGELRKWLFPSSVCLAAAAAIALGCIFWDHVNTIATDSAAMSIGVMIVVWVLRGWREGNTFPRLIMIGSLVIVAIGLRPAYLFVIPWAGCMQFFRPRVGPMMIPSFRLRLRDAIVMIAVPGVVLFAWCGFRYRYANDFSLLPFGHQNMAAVTTQLLGNEELAGLPGALGQLGTEIGRSRVRMSRAGGLAAITSDPLDLREMPDARDRADTYMTIENRWDAMTYHIIVPAAMKLAGDDPIDQHRLLSQLDRQIIATYPDRYFKWWLLAIRRGVWGSAANHAMHPVFLSIMMGLALTALLRWSSLWPKGSRNISMPISVLRPLAFVAMTYGFANLAFVSLSSPPIGRFSDAGFVLMPAWLMAAAAIWIGAPSDVLDTAESRVRKRTDD